MTRLLRRHGTRGLEHLVGAGAYPEVIREIDPADCSRGVDEEFRGSRYIVAVDAGSFVQEIVAADYVCVGIREERVGIAAFAAEVPGFGGRIDANGNGLDS